MLIFKGASKRGKEIKDFLIQASKACEALAKAGEYKAVEHLIIAVTQALSDFDFEKLELPSVDGPAIRASLNTIHCSALAILVAVPNPTFHPDFLVGLLALEILHHKALLSENEDKFIAFCFATSLYKELRDQPVAFFRSPRSQALFNKVKKYADFKEFTTSPPENDGTKEEPNVQEYRKCVIIDHLLAYNNIRFGKKGGALGPASDDYHKWKERRATKVDQGSIRYRLSGKPLDRLPDLRLHPYKTSIPFLGLTEKERGWREEVYIEPYFAMPVMFDVNTPRFCWDRTKSHFESSAPSIPGHTQTAHNPFREALDTVAYEDKEYKILRDFPDTFDRYSPEEIHAIQSLIPQGSKASLEKEASLFHGNDLKKTTIEKRLEGLPDTTIHSFLSLLDKFPHLVVDPRCAIFIRGALFKSGVLSTATPDLVNTLITRLKDCQKQYKDRHDDAAEIRLTSLIGAIRVNKIPPGEDISEQISALKTMETLTEEEKYIRDQELLSLYLLKPTFSPSERTEFFSLWVNLHSGKGRPSDVDPGILQEAEQRAFVEIQLIQADQRQGVLNACSEATSQEEWNVDDFPRCIRGDEEINLALGTRITKRGGESFLNPAIEETTLFKKLGLQTGLRWTFTEDEARNKKTYECASHPDISIEADSAGNVRFLKTIKEEDGKKTQYVCFDPVYKPEPRKIGFLESIEAELNAPQVTDVTGNAPWQITLSEKHRPYVLDNVVLVEEAEIKRGSMRTLKVIHDETTSIQITLSGKKSSVQLVCKGQPPVPLLHVSHRTADILGRLDDRMYATSDGKTTTVSMPLLRFPNEPHGLILQQTEQGVWEVKHDSLKGYQISANLSPIEPSRTNPPIIPPGFTGFMALERSDKPGTVEKILLPVVELNPKYPEQKPGEKSYSSFMTEVEVSPPEGNRTMTLLAVDVKDGKPYSSDRATNAYLAYISLSQHRYADACAFLEKSRATLPPKQLEEIYGFILDWPDTSAEGEKVKDRVRLIQLGWQASPSSAALVQENIKEFKEKLQPKDKAETFRDQHPIEDVIRLYSLLKETESSDLSERLVPSPPPAAAAPKAEAEAEAKKKPAPAVQEVAMKEVCLYDMYDMYDIRVMQKFDASLRSRGKESVDPLREKAHTMIHPMMGKVEEKRKTALLADVDKHCDDLEKELVLKGTADLENTQKGLENKKIFLSYKKLSSHQQIMAMCNPTKAGLAGMQEALSPKTHRHEIDRILGSFIRGDEDLKKLLQDINPPINIEDLKKLLREYLEVSIALKHTEDAIEKISKVPKDGSAQQDALDEIATLLDAKRHVPEGVDERTLRLLLMLEYSCGFILREANVKLVLDLLKNPTCVRQLPPGSGKTKVVLRLMAIMRANGTDLSTIVLPEWLYEQNRQELAHRPAWCYRSRGLLPSMFQKTGI